MPTPRTLFTASLVLAAATVAVAQTAPAAPAAPTEVYASIQGVARDGAGHPLPDVYITVHSLESNSDRNVVSRANGDYQVPDLTAGNYSVTVGRLEYDSPKAAAVTLATADQHTLDVTLLAKPLRKRSLRERILRNPAHS